MHTRRLAGRLALIGAVLAATLALSSAAAGALNPVPTLNLSCASDGTSQFTISFPAASSDYGSFRIRDVRFGAAGTISEPGPIPAGTTLVYTVPDGWDPTNSTVHLGWPEDPNGNDERHITPIGDSCVGDPPPPPSPAVSVDCVAGEITLTFDPSLAVSSWIVLGTQPNLALIDFWFFGAAAGSSATMPLPAGTTEIKVDVRYVDGRSFSETYATACECTWTSDKDFSNVIVRYADGTEVKYDDLDGTTFTVPNDPDNPIVAVWIKAGRDKLDPGDPAPTGYHGNGIGAYHQVVNCDLVG